MLGDLLRVGEDVCWLFADDRNGTRQENQRSGGNPIRAGKRMVFH